FLERGPAHRRPEESTGSGFVISPDGFIVTNDHVIEDATRIEVHFTDGSVRPGSVVGRDPKTDIALVKVDAPEPLAVAPLGDSDQIRVGDWVLAIGTPFGLEHTVTVGVLSAKGRHHVTPDSRYDDFLQTDASINPGNSGGPLFDASGRVIGINTAIRAEAEGIGFSIPINLAKELLPQLRASGHVTRGWLGVQIQEVRPAFAQSFHLDQARGALVAQVFDESPAQRAGIEPGDVIVEFGGHPIASYHDLPRRVAATRPDAEVPLVIVRDGKRRALTAHLDRMREDAIKVASQRPESSNRESEHALRDWGFEVGPREEGSAEQGALVTQVEPGSPAARAGLRSGDVVVEIERSPVESPEALRAQLEGGGESLVLRIQRNGSAHYIDLNR
ncbi:MAG: Do family serine endopeptidase, partial [Myxococcota bacterium]